MRKHRLRICGFLALAALWTVPLHAEELQRGDREMVDAILEQLAPIVEQHEAQGTQALLSWKDLLGALTDPQRTWLQDFRRRHGLLEGAAAEEPHNLVLVEQQYILVDGEAVPVTRQYLPENAYRQYRRMMDDMSADLNTMLRVESGYRSPAYQMVLFLQFLPRHNYSVRENRRFVAFPGRSEHGSLKTPAIDFINVHGINGEEDPRSFEILPEFRWLQANAARYGFELSYPAATATVAYEPWHWRYIGTD